MTRVICITDSCIQNSYHIIVESSHKFCIARYTTQGRTQSDRPFSLHYACMPQGLVLFFSFFFHIMYDYTIKSAIDKYIKS